FVIDNTENVTINGLTVDYEEPLFTQAKIIARDPDGFFFDIEVEDGYYFDLKDTNFFTDSMSVHFFTADGKTHRDSPHSVALARRNIEKLTDNTYRLNALKLVSASKGLGAGDYLTFLSNNEGYPFGIHGSDGFKMNDVTIYSGCVGISENYGNPNTPSVYRNVRMLPGPTPLGATTPRLFSISGTGFHMTGLTKGFEAYDCYVYGNTDDGVNIHGIYHRAYENVGGNAIMVGSGKLGSRFEAGDVLRFYDENYEYIDSATIVSATKADDYKTDISLEQNVGVWTFKPIEKYKVTLDKKVTIAAGSWIENEQEISYHFILKNCQFIEGARGLIIKAGGLVEDCLVQGRPIALRAGPELHWLESGYIRDLTFKNVTFKECGFDKAHVDDRGIFGAGLFGEHDAIKSRNQNITFEGCTFDNNYGVQLYVSESQNVSVKDCTFIAGNNSTQQLYIENLDGITLSGNKFEGSIPTIEKGDNVKNYKEN
ncbi:MAG: right-handed parallel beta-helix repeat-containing protein, partial [Clostridia bacterium]|nr:right-handed parallel beta-helix repeat-containing protein [Clostridia bacterium]